MLHILGGTTFLISRFAELFAFGIEEKDGRVSLHGELLRQGPILVLGFAVQFLLVWEVEAQKNQVVLGG